jgi:hypothetical protein
MERLAERLKQPFAQRGRIVPAESPAHSPADAGEVRP